MSLSAGQVLSATELDGLLGEPLLPITHGSGADEPAIIALDAGGTAVAVEIVERLDQPALLRALEHAGALGRMSRGELAAKYPGGLDAFQRDLSHYLAAVPYRRTAPTARGSRLVLVCGDADPAVLNAMDFLNRPELPIKAFQARQLRAMDGAEFVDVSPLRIHPASPPMAPALALPAAPAEPPGMRAIKPPAAGVSRRELRQRSGVPQAYMTNPPIASEPVASQPRAGQHIASQPISNKPMPSSPAPSALPSRRALRQARGGSLKPCGHPKATAGIEFSGVFAKGTRAEDAHSWDTAAQPVIARPRRREVANRG